jgi:ubiquinone/menaquinone biosynthesis C-methylase UbiE
VNRIHNVICASQWWARRVRDELVPWGIEGIELGEELLEIGPGLGATTRVLAEMPRALTVLELDEGYCVKLAAELGHAATIVRGDATELPFENDRFTAVLCFTMLHHIPDRDLQDRAFAEVARVLRPGGTFAGTDSVGTGIVFKVIHIGDALLPLDPEQLPQRLQAAGLVEPWVERAHGSFRFRAQKRA